MQSSADPPSADKPADKSSPTDKSSTDAKTSIGKPANGDAASASSTKTATTKKKVAARQKRKKKWLPAAGKLTLDPSAPKVGLFDGLADGTLNAKAVPNNALGGTVYIENPSNKPVTVDLPDSFVAVPVLRQMGGGRGGGGAGGVGGAGGAQAAGGGMGGMGGGGMGGGGFGGGGMFSIPAEHTAKLPYTSVCLEHGKTDPDPTMTYKLVPVSEYTDNQQLGALLSLIGKNAIDPQVAQAAAWNLASNMSWQELAAKQSTEVGFTDYRYFTPQALQQAQQLVVEARGLANERAWKTSKPKSDEPKADSKKSDDHVIQGR